MDLLLARGWNCCLFVPLPAASIRPRFDELLPPAFWPLPAPFLIDCLAEEAVVEAAVGEVVEGAAVAAVAAEAAAAVEAGEHNDGLLQRTEAQLGPQEN